LFLLVKMVPRGGIEPPTRGFSIHRRHLESMACVPLSKSVSNFCKSLISGSNRAGQVLPHSPNSSLKKLSTQKASAPIVVNFDPDIVVFDALLNRVLICSVTSSSTSVVSQKVTRIND
jgi:hypothetical protein